MSKRAVKRAALCRRLVEARSQMHKFAVALVAIHLLYPEDLAQLPTFDDRVGPPRVRRDAVDTMSFWLTWFNTMRTSYNLLVRPAVAIALGGPMDYVLGKYSAELFTAALDYDATYEDCREFGVTRSHINLLDRVADNRAEYLALRDYVVDGTSYNIWRE